MESDDFNLHNLREWQPIDDVSQKIPSKVQRGFFYQELNVTCIDVLSEYLGLGSDVGIIFWYNRRNGNVQKLRTEVIKYPIEYSLGQFIRILSIQYVKDLRGKLK